MENHVKMLRAPGAEWIQKAWAPKVGDRTDKGFITGIHIPGATCLIRDESGWVNLYSIKSVLWLPSIGDYLGMVEGDLEDVVRKFKEFTTPDLARFCNIDIENHFHYLKQLKTWPELMLAFVQHECKGLKWDGEGWR